MKSVFVFSGKLLNLIFPLRFAEYLKKIRRAINTGYYGRTLKSIGRHSSIDYPVTKLQGGEYISIGDYVFVGKNSVLTTLASNYNDPFTPKIVIGNNVAIGDDCHFTAINKITIGANVLFGKKVTITDNSHGKNSLEEIPISPIKRELYSKGPVVIKDGVWIGDKVTILPGVSIGANSIIGANSVVSKDIPEYCVAAGIPARTIKKMK
jgi:acetyltransferase-like isoleucine patch superfamily enzyme